MASIKIDLPYGHDTISIRVPSEKLVGTFLPRALPPVPDAARAVREALAQPVSAPRVRDMAAKARRAAIVIEDATRPVPNSLLLDAVMAELEAGGLSPRQVVVVVATGLHRPMSDRELAGALGRWFGVVACENHNANDPNRLTHLGTTSLGTDISLNRSFLEADLRITTGDVEYHQFCGYGGGVKCVYPGLADAAAIRTNHSRMDLPGAGPGSLDDNPVRHEIDEVGRLAGVHFNVSLAMDAEHRIVAVRAGDPYLSFRQACRFIDEMYAVEVPRRAGLVIASPGGHPKDIDLYQSQKAIEEATQVVKAGGDVLVTARCDEGSGSERFEAWMQEAYTAEDIIRRIREDFVMGGHKAYQIAREVQRAKVHLYSEIPPGRVRSWLMTPVRSIADIDQLIARSESVLVLPQATLVRACLSTNLPETPMRSNKEKWLRLMSTVLAAVVIALSLIPGLGRSAVGGNSLRSPGMRSAAALAAQGFKPLFDGKSLAGWDVKSWHEGHWVARDGIIDYDGKGQAKRSADNTLWTKDKFADFVLYAEWSLPAKPEMRPQPIVLFNGDFLMQEDDPTQRVTRLRLDAGDSGILMRGILKCQANIWSQELGSGEINGYRTDRALPQEVRRACIPIRKADRPLGEWNAFEITLRGDRMTVVLNGEKVIDAARLPDLPPTGPIGLQHHGDPVQFRQIFIKPLQ